ncbi:MAG: hypothetical protein AAGE84_07705 [Cyanobacteria bacterium P01_G01_bin.39]
MINKQHILIFSTLLLTVFALNSCHCYQCKAEGKIFIRNHQYSEFLQNDLSKLQLSFDEILKLISSDAIIDDVIIELSKNQQYQEYLSHRQFKKSFNAVKIQGTDVISLSYSHRNANFANEVTNTWIDTIINQRIRRHAEVSENLNALYKDGTSSKTIDEVIRRLRNKNKFKNYLADNDVTKNLIIKRTYDHNLINIDYEHTDPEFADDVVKTWVSVMYDYYGYLSDISKFIVNENITDTGSISLNIYIDNRDIGRIPDILEYADGTCSKPRLFDFK